MSRIGKMPIALPAGVTVEFKNKVVTVKGAKGTLSQAINGNLDVVVEGGNLLVKPLDNLTDTNAKHGLYRAVLAGMVKGVSEGFKKELEIIGIGYKAAMQGKNLVLTIGYSHDINYEIEDGITVETPNPTTIVVTGIDKQRVGEVASVIRSYRKPEPYKGKGIRYKGEHVAHKEGKTAATGA